MQRRMIPFAGWILAAVSALVPVTGLCAERKSEVGRWHLQVYHGQWSENRLGAIMQGNTRWRDSWINAIGIGSTLYRANEHIVIETEANLVRHSGLQGHHEFNMAISMRWLTFPWDDYLNTSVLLGVGPSFAEVRPPIEDLDGRPAAFHLVNLLTEVAFAPPGQEKRSWELFVRVHHRSGLYDLVSEARGSNFPSGGIRFYF